jgi:predicted nucleic acid-binding protein
MNGVVAGLKLPDCCMILAAENAGARIASFDDRLAQVGERRDLTVVRR